MKAQSFEESAIHCLDEFLREVESNTSVVEQEDWITKCAAHFMATAEGDCVKQALYYGILAEAVRRLALANLASR